MKSTPIIISADLQAHPHFEWVNNYQFASFANSQELSLTLSLRQKSDGSAFIIVSENTVQSWPETIFDKFTHGCQFTLALIYSSKNSETQIEWLRKIPCINHLISINAETLSKDVLNLSQFFNEAESKSKNGPAHLNLIKTLKLNESISHELSMTSDRWKIYDEIGKYAENLGCFSDFPEIIKTVASELITNAFYDGKRHHTSGRETHADRTTDFALDGDEVIQIIYGKEDTDYLWIIVKDPFDSLNRKTIIEAMYRAATERKPREGTVGGAGLGLIMLYEWCSSMHFILDGGKSTVVACKLRITKRNRIFESETNSLHICIEN